MKTLNPIKKTNRKLIVITLLVFTLFSGCRTYSVLNSDYDRSTDFSLYKTYAWLPDKDNESSQNQDSIIHNNIKNYFSHHFADFGYKADTENPDLLFEQVITNAIKTRTYTDQHPVISNYNYQRNPYYTSTPNPYGYNNSKAYNYNYKKQNYMRNNGYAYRPRAQQYKSETHTEEYIESTFTLNAIDRKKNKLVWTCTIQANIYNDTYIESGIHPAVHLILKTYPANTIKSFKN